MKRITRPEGFNRHGANRIAGQPAPDFTLDSTKGDPVTLSGLKGKKVVLAFYPAAFTGG